MKKILAGGVVVLALSLVAGGFLVARALSDLPDVSILKHYRPSAAAEVLDRNGSIITEYYDYKFRIWVPLSSLPDIVIKAVLTGEDDTFFRHKGVNYKATWDALVHDFEKRRFSRGGSTITQQMIKNVLLSKEKTITRKLREYVLARKAEEILSKRRILEIYLNEVEWGDNIYGIEAASRYYFDRHASEITPGDAALLAAMLPNPHYFDPFKRPEKARNRQEHVLSNMLQANLIDSALYDSVVDSPLGLRRDNSGRFDFSALKSKKERPCYQAALENVLLRLFGEQALYRGGLTIKTTLDKKLQDELNGREETASRDANPTGPVSIVKKDGRITGLACSSGKESAFQEKESLPGIPAASFGSEPDMTTISLDDITREEIVLSVEGEKQPKSKVAKSSKRDTTRRLSSR